MKRVWTSDWGLLLMRLGFASLLIGFHGWIRLGRAFRFVVYGEPWTFVGLVQNIGFPVPAVFAVLSALSESVAALLVGIGFFSRWAAAILTFNFAVAFYNEAAKGDPFELPALYLLGAAALMILGPGRLSVDGIRGKVKN
ncbi:MAG: DoxX family protein [Acidobacteriota bacterium]